MKFTFDGDGDGLEVRFKVTWSVLRVMLTTLISVIALFSSFVDHLHKLI